MTDLMKVIVTIKIYKFEALKNWRPCAICSNLPLVSIIENKSCSNLTYFPHPRVFYYVFFFLISLNHCILKLTM